MGSTITPILRITPCVNWVVRPLFFTVFTTGLRMDTVELCGHTAPTARSSRCAPRRTGPRSRRCRRRRTWSPIGTCAGSARTAWSPSRPRCTRCPPRGSAPGSGSSCGSPPSWSRCTRSRPRTTPPTAAPPGSCWPCIRGHPRQLGGRRGPLGRAARRPRPGHPRRAGRARPAPRRRRGARAEPARRAADPPGRRRSRGGPPAAGQLPARRRAPRLVRRRRHRNAAMSTLVATRVREHAAKLGVPHLAETAAELVARAEADQLGYLDFVDLLLGEELGLREGRRFRTALKLSGLPHHKTLEQFDFAFQPELDARKVRDLATLAFIDARSNVALLGPPGTGKTMIAVALAVAACQPTAFLRPALLVVDEVGYLPLDRAEANMVFQLVSRRYERGSIIITSNKSFTEWGGVLGDDVLATAILDRLLHHCDVLSINGPSYRLKDRFLTPGGGS